MAHTLGHVHVWGPKLNGGKLVSMSVVNLRICRQYLLVEIARWGEETVHTLGEVVNRYSSCVSITKVKQTKMQKTV